MIAARSTATAIPPCLSAMAAEAVVFAATRARTAASATTAPISAIFSKGCSPGAAAAGSAERRVGTECVSTCGYLWSHDHYTNNSILLHNIFLYYLCRCTHHTY